MIKQYKTQINNTSEEDKIYFKLGSNLHVFRETNFRWVQNEDLRPKNEDPLKSFWNHLKYAQTWFLTEVEQGATRFAVFIDFSQGLRFVYNPP